MSFKMTKQGTTNEFMCDTAEDVTAIPKDQINFGSIAVVVKTGQIFIADSKKVWNSFGISTEEGD